MPNNRDVALPAFGKALALYEQVARDAPKDSFQARVAALGKARALEARYELSKAIEQYQLVVKSWPGTPEADQAKQLADALQKPEAAAFYKDLYAYAPTKMTLPPFSTEKLDFPSTNPTTKTGPTGLPLSPTSFPLELAPPDVELVKPKSAQAQDKTKPGGATPELPADPCASTPAAAKEKAPR